MVEPIVHRFDMRWIDNKQFARKLEAAEREAVAKLGSPVERSIVSEGKVMVVSFLPAGEKMRLAALEGELTKNVDEINQGNRMSKVTAASELGDLIRNSLAGMKARLAKTAENAKKSFAELDDTANLTDEMVKQVEREAADLKAALGLNSNHPPADA